MDVRDEDDLDTTAVLEAIRRNTERTLVTKIIVVDIGQLLKQDVGLKTQELAALEINVVEDEVN